MPLTCRAVDVCAHPADGLSRFAIGVRAFDTGHMRVPSLRCTMRAFCPPLPSSLGRRARRGSVYGYRETSSLCMSPHSESLGWNNSVLRAVCLARELFRVDSSMYGCGPDLGARLDTQRPAASHTAIDQLPAIHKPDDVLMKGETRRVRPDPVRPPPLPVPRHIVPQRFMFDSNPGAGRARGLASVT